MAHRQQLRNAAHGWFCPVPDKMEVANSYDAFVPAAKLASDIVGGSNVPLKMGTGCCKYLLVTVSGSILQLADDDSTSTLNLEKKRRDDRLWWLASMLIFAGALV
jgi:hypothetical protein